MICASCRNEIPDNSVFCNKCGTKIQPEITICHACGAEIPSHSVFCNKCGVRLFSSDVDTNSVLHENTEQKDKKKQQFSLGGRILSFEDKIRRVSKLYSKFLDLSADYKKEFEELLGQLFTLTDAIEKAVPELQKYENQLYQDTVEIFMQYGIDYISAKRVKEESADYCSFSEMWTPLLTKAGKIAENREQIRQQRNYERANRSYWQGGGFGMRGAIKGAVKAGVMNSVTNAFRGIGDSLTDKADNKRILEQEQALVHDASTWTSIFDSLHANIMGLFEYSYDVLKKKGVVPTWDYDTTDLDDRVVNYFEMYHKDQTNKEKLVNSIIDCISENPLNVDCYVWLYLLEAVDYNDIKKMMTFYGLYKHFDDKIWPYRSEMLRTVHPMPEETIEQIDLKIAAYENLTKYDKDVPIGYHIGPLKRERSKIKKEEKKKEEEKKKAEEKKEEMDRSVQAGKEGATANHPNNGCFTVSDMFYIDGRGTEIVGTVKNSSIKLHDILELWRKNTKIQEVTVVGIEKFRQLIDEAQIDDEVGLLLQIDREKVCKGDILKKPSVKAPEDIGDGLAQDLFSSFTKVGAKPITPRTLAANRAILHSIIGNEGNESLACDYSQYASISFISKAERVYVASDGILITDVAVYVKKADKYFKAPLHSVAEVIPYNKVVDEMNLPPDEWTGRTFAIRLCKKDTVSLFNINLDDEGKKAFEVLYAFVIHRNQLFPNDYYYKFSSGVETEILCWATDKFYPVKSIKDHFLFVKALFCPYCSYCLSSNDNLHYRRASYRPSKLINGIIDLQNSVDWEMKNDKYDFLNMYNKLYDRVNNKE